MTCPATGERFCATSPWVRDGDRTTRTCPACGAVYTYRPPKPRTGPPPPADPRLSEITTLGEFSTSRGLSRTALNMRQARGYEGFPTPVGPIAGADIYLRAELAAWCDAYEAQGGQGGRGVPRPRKKPAN